MLCDRAVPLGLVELILCIIGQFQEDPWRNLV